MWKIIVGFLAFAGLAIFIMSKGGDIDMGGEKHGEPIQTEKPAAVLVTPGAAAPAAAPAK